MQLRPRVYVAGPYTTGNPETNTDYAIAVGDRLLDLGFSPFVPHLSHYWETLHSKHSYETWMALDFAWVAVADYVLRLPGASDGADREVGLANELGIPVCYSMEQLTKLAGKEINYVG